MDARTTVTLEGFGERLRRLRSAAGISQDELARRSGLSTAGVGALERGVRRAPQRETIALLANALSLGEQARTDLERAAERGRARSRTPSPDALAATHNLPVQLTSFVGRADHIERMKRRIETSRLVTVVGSGGVGKTRLTLEVAMHLATNAHDEVRFIDLAPLQDESLVTGRIAGTLGIRLSGSDDRPESLARALNARRVLLVLDNCEHLIVGVTETARVLLQRCPQIKILATSRERLGIMGEVVHRLPPMTLPDASHRTIADARSCSALELFLQRAHSADPDLTFSEQQAPVLIDVCRRLEGIPLAIELAAARLPTLGLEGLNRRLEATFVAARGMRGLPGRQRTMHDTIAWSYDLLTEPERSLLRRLGVFAGGCTLAAAEAVCSGSDLQLSHVAGVLASLVDKSLVNNVIDAERMRYELLDSTRAFARDQLAQARDGHEIFHRHARWLAAHSDGAMREYIAKPNFVWLDEFWPEIDNARVALQWATQSKYDEDAALAGQIAGNFRGLWLIPGLFPECRRWMALLLGRVDEVEQPSVTVELLAAMAQSSTGSERIAATDRFITAMRRLGDRRRLARGLSWAGWSYIYGGLVERAQEAVDESWELSTEDRLGQPPSPETIFLLIDIAITRAHVSLVRDQLDDARAQVTEAFVHAERNDDQFVLVQLLSLRAEIEFTAGDIERAAQYSKDAVERAKTIPRGTALLAHALCRDVCIRLSSPDIGGVDAAACYAFNLTRSVGDEDLIYISSQNVAGAAARRGQPQAAARLLGSIETWRDAVGYRPRVSEEAARELLVTALREDLGAQTDTYIAEGRPISLELATNEALAMIEP